MDARRRPPSVNSLIMATAAALGAPLHAQMIAGEGVPVSIAPRSSDVSARKPDAPIVWSYEIRHPGASYIAVHFAAFDLKAGERLRVSDGAGKQVYALEGKGKKGAGSFWARHVKGNVLRLSVVLADKPRDPGFLIDEYVAGFAEPKPGDAWRAICGEDDKTGAACIRDSHAAEYQRGQAVARLLVNGRTLCTGWLASTDGHLITTQHCIATEEDALNTDFEFMAEAPSCGDEDCALCFEGTVFSGATLVKSDAFLDYALVRITDGNPAAAYGFLELDPREPEIGEPVYIPQHPGGRAKEFALFSSEVDDLDGVSHVQSIDEPPCTGGGHGDVGYFADTEPSSSGAPVLAASNHKVIALHHCANCPNRGVPIHLIYERVRDHLIYSGIHVAPAPDFHSSGLRGGPFTPQNVEYTVRNLNDSQVDYMVHTEAPWLTIAGVQGGPLGAGEEAVVAVEINALAGALPNGKYRGTIEFVNDTSAEGSTVRDAVLTVGAPRVVRRWNFDADPGWRAEGQWAFGRPGGAGGEFGGPDPQTAFTGENVYGHNLTGDYANDMSEERLTSEPIDCRGLADVRLRFRRWLGVEQPAFDHARLEVGRDDDTWMTVWANRTEISDASWVLQEFDISGLADGQQTIYLRWTMGPTDSAWRYCGWNIDDVELSAIVAKPGVLRRPRSIE